MVMRERITPLGIFTHNIPLSFKEFKDLVVEKDVVLKDEDIIKVNIYISQDNNYVSWIERYEPKEQTIERLEKEKRKLVETILEQQQTYYKNMKEIEEEIKSLL